MNNTPVNIKGKEYWISRSIACITFVFAKDEKGQLHYLLIKRGKAVSNTGKWSVPGGYLDYDESLEQCAKREIFEETGISLITTTPNYLFGLSHIDDEPEGNAQNVVMIFVCYLPKTLNKYNLTTENADEDEITDVQWEKTDVDTLTPKFYKTLSRLKIALETLKEWGVEI
jgi:ADP-ribose pyrophosphatase YjhB (NUDIX family)